MSKQWEGGSTTEWRRVRALVLARDGGRCRMQYSPRCTGVATHVHHTAPRSVVGDDPAHLVASCAPCNLAYGDPTHEKHGDPEPVARTKW